MILKFNGLYISSPAYLPTELTEYEDKYLTVHWLLISTYPFNLTLSFELTTIKTVQATQHTKNLKKLKIN